MKTIIIFALFCFIVSGTTLWSEEKANQWYEQQPWMAGCNFIPSSAVNQLEMWQAESFDIPTITKEVGWAQDLGFNTFRVFLHYIAWDEDKQGLLERMDKFLDITYKAGIRVAFVLFDDCWNSDPKPGEQPPPIPSVHNSQWVQCLGYPYSQEFNIEAYIQDILTRFADDERVVFWDLYNEPGNSGHEESTFPLLKKVFELAREVDISQPITSCKWTEAGWASGMNEFVLSQSDINTFHQYGDVNSTNAVLQTVQTGRPVVCTEYMARPLDSWFFNVMPFLKDQNVGAINWGLVFGKTQTIFPWGSQPYSPIPELWFHDIFWQDGTPFDEKETDFIKSLTKQQTNILE